jgi:flagellar hook-associated protein 1 FlgK
LQTDVLRGVIGAQLKLAADPSIVLQPNGSADSKLTSFLDLFSAAAGDLPSGANSLMTALTQLASFNKGDAATSLTQLDATLQSLALQSNSADEATGASALQTNLLAGWRGFISNVGAQVSVHLSGQTASAAVDKQLTNEFQSQSGVNLDEEAANLLKYQQSYTAASKILQANAAMLDGLMAVVGR